MSKAKNVVGLVLAVGSTLGIPSSQAQVPENQWSFVGTYYNSATGEVFDQAGEGSSSLNEPNCPPFQDGGQARLINCETNGD